MCVCEVRVNGTQIERASLSDLLLIGFCISNDDKLPETSFLEAGYSLVLPKYIIPIIFH